MDLKKKIRVLIYAGLHLVKIRVTQQAEMRRNIITMMPRVATFTNYKEKFLFKNISLKL